MRNSSEYRSSRSKNGNSIKNISNRSRNSNTINSKIEKTRLGSRMLAVAVPEKTFLFVLGESLSSRYVYISISLPTHAPCAVCLLLRSKVQQSLLDGKAAGGDQSNGGCLRLWARAREKNCKPRASGQPAKEAQLATAKRKTAK